MILFVWLVEPCGLSVSNQLYVKIVLAYIEQPCMSSLMYSSIVFAFVSLVLESSCFESDRSEVCVGSLCWVVCRFFVLLSLVPLDRSVGFCQFFVLSI
ncbi:hypothetical protein Hanom_Chr00s000006g01613101 [Helianthus anomalus]